ncbi:ribosomal 5S rRNA E-loop binding protein Ctc/L25/TL5 [Segniliparus rotundus DSM 44985]|uniref:Large ribosomal subunit protein bL25 n=1 Tax=Segniliparus rotundus (strain ATCC BAA-972 / CDC 1076 / CIP 108378 / DSM 44985 / JCM 13578) TaxID=640132 RepID=D6ZC18_SEGRD|nr:50S ribosomal protein L25/general stress protein Ctc [Segniliparus rotundus]ADG96995.1 ribosomal 5S rRNA E-loop binding protein Ctc/L25/TL5 [Segniliparus rotundus DSM 44985]
MAETARVEATVRDEFGKGASRRARRDGHVPAVLYGHGIDPKHFNIPAKEFARVLRANGVNAIVSLHAGGEEHLALTKTVVVHPTKSYLQHVDLQVIRRGERIAVDVPVVLTGSAASGSVVQHETTTLSVEAEAMHIPEQIEVSIEGLEIGSKIIASELELPEAVSLTGDPEQMIVQINEARAAQVEQDSAEGSDEAEADSSAEDGGEES